MLLVGILSIAIGLGVLNLIFSKEPSYPLLVMVGVGIGVLIGIIIDSIF